MLIDSIPGILSLVLPGLLVFVLVEMKARRKAKARRQWRQFVEREERLAG